MRQLFAMLLRIIIPEPTFAAFLRCAARLKRHLIEPRRRRRYQKLILVT